ncbi:HNH endonuclease signature motif containing protein [Fictibacillus nanhaiensis]|uniref:HNH endonuclease signature motif containing protein n=1 Tax=Fictibacillus nanhaiensis TaxID=742169 RepID=UPI002E1C87AA|nr:HNH endonuclease signature motif containing protein [Fictibacillus nanhaiensis]
MIADNFYQTKSNKVDGFHPYCKKCATIKSTAWQQSIDPERRRAYFRKCDSSDRRKKIKSENNAKRRAEGKEKTWRQQNKDKLSEYGKLRRMNKTHEITEEEWIECLEFFNYKCAYCGMTEEEHYNTIGQQLHKEHVEHTGANDITNCVPSCKNCNSQKWEFDFHDWYTEDKSQYSKRRYNKIIKWLMNFIDSV